MQRLLSFDQMLPLPAVLRFLLTAPLFAVGAGLLLLWKGEAALTSRWAGPTLALTHLLTLGFLGMAMTGALLQILAVVAGVRVLAPARTALAVWAALLAGAVLLPVGFVTGAALSFRLAAVLLAAGFGWLLLAALAGLLRPAPAGARPTVNGIRLALLSLGVTVCIGVSLAAMFGWQRPLPALRLTDLHAAWGLLGWIALLVAGVAFQVIPMFQSTPLYPPAIAKTGPALHALLLAAWSIASATGSGLRFPLELALALSAAGFAAQSLRLLHRRKRPKADPTTLFLRLAFASLAASAAAFELPLRAAPLLAGMLFLAGFAMSAVCGMLYKIVPFLLWYRLQANPQVDRQSAPNIRRLLPDAAALRQFHLHWIALALLAGAIAAPGWLARLAGAALAGSALMLWMNMVRSALHYRRATAPATTTTTTTTGAS